MIVAIGYFSTSRVELSCLLCLCVWVFTACCLFALSVVRLLLFGLYLTCVFVACNFVFLIST